MRRRPQGWWPALPLAALGLAAVIALLGTAFAPARSPTEQVTDTLDDFAKALQERRGDDACALLTERAQQGVAARTGTLDCATTLETFGLGIDAAALRAARAVRVTVTGERATIARADLRQPDGTPFGAAVTFERVSGRWRVASLL